MIDIHSHIIFGVDDGAANIDASLSMISEMIEVGVTDIICTPHYRLNMFETSVQTIKNNFDLLVEKIRELNLNVNLYLGREIYYHKSVYSNLDDFKMNNKKIVLVEFSSVKDPDIEEVLYNFKRLDYKVIIAHVERYEYLTINDVFEIKSKNVLIQVNASTIMGRSGLKQKSKVMKLIKANLVDFVASDIHSRRNNHMLKAYNVVKKKFGEDVANKLFNLNAKSLINVEGD